MGILEFFRIRTRPQVVAPETLCEAPPPAPQEPPPPRPPALTPAHVRRARCAQETLRPISGIRELTPEQRAKLVALREGHTATEIVAVSASELRAAKKGAG